MHTAQSAQRVGAVRKQNAVRNVMQCQRLAAQKFAISAVNSDAEGPGTNPSGFAAEWSTKDMAAARAKISQ